jgi:myo-inositol-1(or 4)-monophosphatase
MVFSFSFLLSSVLENIHGNAPRNGKVSHNKTYRTMLLLLLGCCVFLTGCGTGDSFRVTTAPSLPRSNQRLACAVTSTSAILRDIFQDVAIKAVKKAGRKIKNGSGAIDLNDPYDITSKIGSRDIVTWVDVEAQEVIKKTLSSAFPFHTILGEEDLPPGREAATQAINDNIDEEHLWIIDPVDGTTNFAHGQPLCGVILAYASKGKVRFGCIYDPFRNEVFTAWEGQGAYLNGEQIRCCDTPLLKSSIVCTGSPPNYASLMACLRATNMISAEVRTMRMLGSAAIMLSWLACGRVTAYFEGDMNVWDVAAGALIVREAGGKVTDVWGEEYTLQTRNFVASNGKIHEELRGRLVASEMWLKEEDLKVTIGDE